MLFMRKQKPCSTSWWLLLVWEGVFCSKVMTFSSKSQRTIQDHCPQSKTLSAAKQNTKPLQTMALLILVILNLADDDLLCSKAPGRTEQPYSGSLWRDGNSCGLPHLDCGYKSWHPIKERKCLLKYVDVIGLTCPGEIICQVDQWMCAD